eukprot:1160676-Pelagomonas_calceolata.AAC.2
MAGLRKGCAMPATLGALLCERMREWGEERSDVVILLSTAERSLLLSRRPLRGKWSPFDGQEGSSHRRCLLVSTCAGDPWWPGVSCLHLGDAFRPCARSAYACPLSMRWTSKSSVYRKCVPVRYV